MSSEPGVIDCPPLHVNNSYYSFQGRTTESAVCLRALPVPPLVHTERLKWSLHLLLLLFCLSLSLFSFSSSWGRVISLIVGSHCFRRNLFHGSSAVSGDTHKTNCQRGGVKSPLSKPCSVSMLMPPIVFLLAGRISPGTSLDGVYLLCKFALKHAHASRDQGQVCLCKCDQEVRRLNMDKARSTEALPRALILLDLHVNLLNLLCDTPHEYTSTCTPVVLHKNLWKSSKQDLPGPHIWKHQSLGPAWPPANTPPPIISFPGMDPPKEMAVSDVTEDAVTISWIKPLAPFEYYKLSYQSARGSPSLLNFPHVQ